MVEDAHGEGHLGKLAVGHFDIGLEATVLRAAHTGEVHAVLRAPVGLLEVAQVVGHHGHLGAPVLQSDECAHANLVYAGLPHAVVSVEPPLVVRLRAARVVDLVAGLVVRFLEADHAVKPVAAQLGVVLRAQWHHLNLQVVEVGLGQVEGAGDVFHARHGRILASEHEQVVERAELLYGLILAHYLLLGEHRARHLVLHVEAAVDARVGARVGDVNRYEHIDGLAETLARVHTAQAGHLFKVFVGGGRHKRHEIVYRQVVLREGAAHVGVGLRHDFLGCLVPAYLLYFVVKHSLILHKMLSKSRCRRPRRVCAWPTPCAAPWRC